MIGVVLFVSVFCAVGFAYACTEYAMTSLDLRQRVTVGQAGLTLILAVHALSLAALWLSAIILVAASGQRLYLQASVIAVGGQAIWLSQHLWTYYRDHLHVRNVLSDCDVAPRQEVRGALFRGLDELYRDAAERAKISVQGVALASEYNAGERAGEH